MPTIIRTCLNILATFSKANPYSSFVFIGERSEKDKEKLSRRYRIYKYVTRNFISPTTFEHVIKEEYNLYALINKNHTEKNSILNEIDYYYSNS
ncbi:MAG: hypothetical protein H6579_07975 [Chitinophagales bacterium]|nr:hypothetical protein [Chitinophagales bacterium]